MGVSSKDFENMLSRVQGKAAKDAPSKENLSFVAPEPGQTILGVDPSLRGTGYGVIKVANPVSEVLTMGVIKCPQSWKRSQCLAAISSKMRKLVKDHSPQVCVIESLFYAQNYRTALTMGEARGASLAAIAEGGLTIYELAPRKVKQAIVGYGAAQKEAVAKMVQRMLQLDEVPQEDAADALALALTHVQIHVPGSLNQPKPL